MALEKSCSEICKDLLTLVKTFQKAYIEQKKDSQDLPIQEEEEQEEVNLDQQIKGKEKEGLKEQGKKEQVAQGKKAENLQGHTSEAELIIQQIDSDLILWLDLIKKRGERRRKASTTRLRRRVWFCEFRFQWNGGEISRRHLGEFIRSGKGERGREVRGKGGSYKTRKKKRKERAYLMDWNFKENG